MNKDKTIEPEVIAQQIELHSREILPGSKTPKEEHEYTLAEYVDVKTGKTDIMPKEIIERYLTEILTQIKLALDVVWYEGIGQKRHGIKPVDAVKGLFVIAHDECATAASLLEPYHDASLNPKHRASKKVINTYMERIEPHREKLFKSKSTKNGAIKAFVRETLDFITTFHIVLSEETSKKERASQRRNYCG
tara:strand:+ start:4241 stop:4816 length:576 start_codon:yes stop_codon:yes gene_type:complete